MTIAPPPNRRHDVAGTYNLRDTGGYPAETGTTRWGRLFRSDALHGLTDASREHFAELGIALVVDLRDERELAGWPSRLDGLDITTVHAPIFSGAAPASLADVTLDGLYATMIADYGVPLADAVRLIARSGNQKVLVHCTAGKDRTGLVVALALRAAGVDRAAVIADYAASDANLRGEWATAMLERVAIGGIVPNAEIERLISASPPESIAAVLDLVETGFGSAAAYLEANGLEPADIELLREVLVEPASADSSSIAHATSTPSTPASPKEHQS